MLESEGMTLAQSALDAANTAWMLVACSMVLLMTPALALFYGGMVRSKNALNTMMMSFASLGLVGLVWALGGYSLAFGSGNAWIGNLDFLFLRNVDLAVHDSGVAHLLFMAFQGTFAIITAALISGAIVERMRFGPYMFFISAWVLAVYAPICHWVWGGGWLARMGALDFAGGTVVHVNAGIAALVAARVLGPRKDHGRQALLPHNVPLVLLGTAMLWFGWLGFNGGSALAANSSAVLAFVNTILAPAATLTVWMLLDLKRTGNATAIGAATGIVVGLVAITPGAGFMGPMSAIVVGALAAFPSYFGILWLSKTSLDDSLDVAAAHGLGGLVGALLTGLFAQATWGGTDGALFGNLGQLWVQVVGIVAALTYSGVVSLVLLKLIDRFAPLRASSRSEGVGLDVLEHGETAYTNGEGALLILPDPSPSSATSVLDPMPIALGDRA